MKIAVLMSGGVDSTVAAALLQEQGCEVVGLTMRQMEDETVLTAARAAAEQLGIPHHSIDLRDIFQQQVIDYFCSAYAKGLTPNPCVACNRHIKFGALLEVACSIGYEFIATGHYVRNSYDPATRRWRLEQGADFSKDQSYFLWSLEQQQLAAARFPLGALSKAEVRQIARERGIMAADAPDSQEICFVESDYREFLHPRIDPPAGAMVDNSGRVIGTHQGLAWYTIGQRKGLGISAGRPLYVIELDPLLNRVVLGDNDELYRTQVSAGNLNFIVPAAELREGLIVEAKIRYSSHSSAAMIVKREADYLELSFEQPQRAVTPGQSLVLYRGNEVLGGGIISG